MNALIFSKDRAMQLHACLSSMYEHADIFDRVTVLYKTTHWESYEVLKLDFPKVKWVAQQGFKSDFLANLGKLTCLLVDDDIFFRQVHRDEIETAFEECDIFSLRLGDNITVRSHFDVRSSVDGNVFRRETLQQLKRVNFSNPNQLESRLAKYTEGLTMCWPHRSKLVGVPNNRVSSTSHCHHMGGKVEELHEMFLQGFRIDYQKMDLDHNNVHKEVEFELRQIPVTKFSQA